MIPSVLTQTFQLRLISFEDQKADFSLTVNGQSPVFEGHFPGNPILPGVMMVEAVRQGVCTIFSGNYQLQSSLAIKFLAVINPALHPETTLSIIILEEGTSVKIDSKIFVEEIVFFKMKGIFTLA